MKLRYLLPAGRKLVTDRIDHEIATWEHNYLSLRGDTDSAKRMRHWHDCFQEFNEAVAAGGDFDKAFIAWVVRAHGKPVEERDALKMDAAVMNAPQWGHLEAYREAREEAAAMKSLRTVCFRTLETFDPFDVAEVKDDALVLTEGIIAEIRRQWDALGEPNPGATLLFNDEVQQIEATFNWGVTQPTRWFKIEYVPKEWEKFNRQY